MNGDRTPSRDDDAPGGATGPGVKDLFAAALEAEDKGGSAQRVLEGLDDARRKAVQSLLEAHRRASGRLLEAKDDGQTGWSGLGGPVGGSSEVEIEKPVIEGYEIGEEIGRGGFGIVFRAVQRAPVERPVAVKLLRNELATRAVVSRFRAEGRVLARMNHPGIARVLDAGLDAKARPYVVMELVDGLPILEACDRHGLSVRGRVELMARVCEAVHHAHQRAIIHRDLKPANMLVESVDGGLRPRVIDFGIAKLLDREEGETVTLAGDRLGTPRYMSPEQSSGQDSADVRTDVYALGVVLCEVLTGKVPREGQDSCGGSGSGSGRGQGFGSGLKSGPAGGSGLRSGSVSGKVRPSALALADPKTAHRARLLKGDLDRIVLKAVARYPEARYPSAMAMAQDLRRYLEGRAVLATAPGPVYLTMKFVGRHRAIAALAGVVVLAVVAAGFALSYGAREARLGRLEAETALDAAQSERARAEAMAGFLLGSMLSALDPDQYQSSERSLADILRATADEARRTLADEPAVKLGVLERVGHAMRAVGDVGGAAGTLDEAADLSALERGPGHESTLHLRIEALLSKLSSRAEVDHQAEIDRVVRLAEMHHSARSSVVLRARVHKLHVLPVEERLEYAQRINDEIEASDHAGSAVHYEAMQYLASILLSSDPKRSLELAQRVLEESIIRNGDRHSQTIELRFTHAQALGRLGLVEQAEREYQTLLTQTRQIGGPRSLYFHTALLNLARLARERGDLNRALELAREEQGYILEQHGEASVHHAAILRFIASCHGAGGDWEQAEGAYLAALDAYARYDKPEMLLALHTRLEYAEVLGLAERWEEIPEVLELVRATLAPDHRTRVQAAVVIATALQRTRGENAARRFIEEELEAAEEASGASPFALTEWLERSRSGD